MSASGRADLSPRRPWIDGRPCDARFVESFPTVNPATEAILTTLARGGAAEAGDLGLVAYVWEGSREELREQVDAYARQFCPPHKASLAVGKIKRSVPSGLEISLEQALALERELQEKLFRSADAKEGLEACVSKPIAEFDGRRARRRGGSVGRDRT